MGKTYVLTFIAEDRPGLVERLSDAVSHHDGNWLESRMAHLAGKFAGIARIEISGDKIPSFKKALAALGAEGLRITAEEATVSKVPAGRLLTLDLVGADHPGIVRDVSGCLARHGVSVEEMETDVREAPMEGALLFYAQARVRSPAGLSEERLRQALEELGAALMVDITLSAES